MKKNLLFAALVAACTLAFAGCGKKDVNALDSFGSTTNGIYLYENLALDDVVYADFDETKYDAVEFKGFLEEDVAAYNAEHDFTFRTDSDGNPDTSFVSAPISVVKCEGYDHMIEMRLRYSSAEDLVAYNPEDIAARGGDTLKSGLLSEAPDEVKNAVLTNAKGAEVTLTSLFEKDQAAEYRYIECNFDAVLYGDGKVYAFSPNAEYNSSYGCITCTAGQTVIVIFK